MSTDIKKIDKRDYVEKVMSMTDARFISEAENFRFEKRRTPVSTWIAAACFTLLFAAAALLLLKPMKERQVNIPATSSDPTVIPTAGLTDEPAADPTADPTEAPFIYNRTEYDALLAFFEIADENGVKNGEKCFKDYDPARADFWGTEPVDSDGSWLFWNESGYLTQIILNGTEDAPIMLAGELKLYGADHDVPDDTTFIHLESISGNHVTFDSIDIKNCPVAEVNLDSVNDAFFIDSNAADRFAISSESRVRYVSSFTVDLTAEGKGKVSVSGGVGEAIYNVYVHAEPIIEGYDFIGWFDAEGNLISNEESFEISYIDETGSGNHGINDFTGTARFASAEQSELVTDSWYLEKAWEYAELANRLYGFNFQKDNWTASIHALNPHIRFNASENEAVKTQLAVYFDSDYDGKLHKEVRDAWLHSGSSGRPANYEDLTDEEWQALVSEVKPEGTFTITREMLAEAGYTLDGINGGLDYIKIAEFIAKRKAALLTGCSDNNPEHCIEAEIDYVSPVDGDTYFDDHPDLNPFSYQLFVRPSHAHAFISCNDSVEILAADDEAHPGWLVIGFSITIADADGAWECESPFGSN